MAYGEYWVECQGWTRWPKVLLMCRKHGDGIERRRYVPDAGTCEVEESWHGESEMVEYRCTACDEYMAVEVKPDGAQRPNYCPNCGRKVVGR